MSPDLTLADSELERAAHALLDAAVGMLERHPARPAAPATTTGCSAEIDRYLAGLDTACAALSDAARAASVGLAALRAAGSELDRALAAALPPDYLLSG